MKSEIKTFIQLEKSDVTSAAGKFSQWNLASPDVVLNLNILVATRQTVIFLLFLKMTSVG